jgi:hypothetical protein
VQHGSNFPNFKSREDKQINFMMDFSGMDLDELVENPWASEGEQQPQYQVPQQQPPQIDLATRQRIRNMMNRVSDEIEECYRSEYEKRLEQMPRSHEDSLRAMQAQHAQKLQPLTPPFALRPPTPQFPPAHTPQPTIRDSREGLLPYVKKLQLKAISVPRFEGKKDRHLVTGFLAKVRLVGTILELRPHVSAIDSNKMIDLV